MYPNLFGIEFLDSYAIMMCIAILAFAIVFLYKMKELHVDFHMKEDLILICIISGCLMYVGAFLFDAIFHSIEEGKLTFGGITFLGGFITALISFSILYITIIKRERKNLLYFLNIVITGVVIAHAFGRIGCFLSGCCYGRETTSFLGVTFPKGSSAWFQYGYNHKVLPTQLFEAIFLFVLFFVLFFIKKNQFKIYLVSYGTYRFILEFFRGDDRGSLFGTLSPSQFICIIMVIGGIILFILNPNQTRIPDETEYFINSASKHSKKENNET